jgi:hypothetical protein
MVIASEARVLESWMTSKGRESQLKHRCFYWYIERFYNFLVNLSPGCMYIRNKHDKLPTHDIPYLGTRGEMNERRQVKEATEFDSMRHRAEGYVSAAKED